MKTTRNVFLLATAVLGSTALGQTTYKYYDLGQNFTPNNISQSTGYIVGKFTTSTGDIRDAYCTFTCVGSTATVSAVNLVPLLAGQPHQDSGLPTSVNDSGYVTGVALPVNGPYGYEWNLVTQNTPVQLPGPSGTNQPMFALALNNSNVIAGQVISAPMVTLWGALWLSGPGTLATAIADPFAFQGAFSCSFFQINNLGDCLANLSNSTTVANFYDHGTWTGIGGATTVAALNDNNQIAGSYPHPTNTAPLSTYNPTACIWSSPSASPTPLDNATQWSSKALALNNSQTVVGFLNALNTGPNQAFVWSSATGMVNLNTAGVVFPALPTGVSLMSGMAIDKFGDIVGTSSVMVNHVPQTHAFLLVPNTGGA